MCWPTLIGLFKLIWWCVTATSLYCNKFSLKLAGNFETSSYIIFENYLSNYYDKDFWTSTLKNQAQVSVSHVYDALKNTIPYFTTGMNLLWFLLSALHIMSFLDLIGRWSRGDITLAAHAGTVTESHPVALTLFSVSVFQPWTHSHRYWPTFLVLHGWSQLSSLTAEQWPIGLSFASLVNTVNETY